MNAPSPRRPLDGVRVLEMGQLIAGPFAGCILGYFGAEVIKLNHPAAATRCGNGGCFETAPRCGGLASGATKNRFR